LKDLIIVDGYNFIFNYFNAKKMDSDGLLYLREQLIRDLVGYRHWRKCDLIVVFDAKDSNNRVRNIQTVDDIEIIYSSRSETADSIIEEFVYSKQKYRRIFVVTSDYLEQKVIFRDNIYRKSIREFGIEIGNSKKRIKEKIDSSRKTGRKSFYLLEKRLDDKSKKKFSIFRRK